MKITDNDKYWLGVALDTSAGSPDPSRKTGCALRTASGAFATCNRFPDGVTVTPGRLERPAKYVYMEHAERNAIYLAARCGNATQGGTIYLTWYPCADCARAIVQAGITRLVGTEPNWAEDRYGFRDAEAILKEGGVTVDFVEAQ